MRKKFALGTIVKGAKALSPIRKKMLTEKISPEFKEAIKKHKKLLDRYKNKPLDENAVKQSYKIFTKDRK
jgi:hypothetical protein